MAQVEFAGVLSNALRRIAVHPGGLSGNVMEKRKVLMALLRGSHNDGPTLKVSKAEDVCVEAVAR